MPAPASGSSYDAVRARCVQRTNQYRATRNVRPLARRSDQEACVDAQAQGDAAAASPHANFGRCREMAQNECPAWRGSPSQMVDACLQAMFNEGPGQGMQHGHYNNMMNPAYTSLSCGLYVAPDGKTWLVQDFFQ